MKLLTTLFTFLFLTTIISAQSDTDDDSYINPEWHQKGDLQYGAYLGFTTNILSVDTDFEVEEDASGNSFLLGVQADYFLGKNWSIKGRLNYENRDYGGDATESVLTAPVAFSWHFGKNRRWHMSLGVAYNLSLDGVLDNGFASDFNIGVIIPISSTRFFIEIDGITQNDALGTLNSQRSSLNLGILF